MISTVTFPWWSTTTRRGRRKRMRKDRDRVEKISRGKRFQASDRCQLRRVTGRVILSASCVGCPCRRSCDGASECAMENPPVMHSRIPSSLAAAAIPSPSRVRAATVHPAMVAAVHTCSVEIHSRRSSRSNALETGYPACSERSERQRPRRGRCGRTSSGRHAPADDDARRWHWEENDRVSSAARGIDRPRNLRDSASVACLPRSQ